MNIWDIFLLYLCMRLFGFWSRINRSLYSYIAPDGRDIYVTYEARKGSILRNLSTWYMKICGRTKLVDMQTFTVPTYMWRTGSKVPWYSIEKGGSSDQAGVLTGGHCILAEKFKSTSSFKLHFCRIVYLLQHYYTHCVHSKIKNVWRSRK